MYKYHSLILVFFCTICFTLFACKKTPTSSCIDSSRINAEALCTMQYEPVCGCDLITYANACHADRAGVTNYAPGACADKQK